MAGELFQNFWRFIDKNLGFISNGFMQANDGFCQLFNVPEYDLSHLFVGPKFTPLYVRALPASISLHHSLSRFMHPQTMHEQEAEIVAGMSGMRPVTIRARCLRRVDGLKSRNEPILVWS